MELSYAQQTVDSPNPLARYAHRSRMRKSVDLALARCGGGRILDYGCGSGLFIGELLARRADAAVGYEPFMAERVADGLPIFNAIADVEAAGPYGLVTLFETVEHLSDEETAGFLATCDRLLSAQGGILVSGPIEIGPALIAKELNRSLLRGRTPEHRLVEFVKACLFGIPARRAEDIKHSHRGFDFRAAIAFFERSGWQVEVLHYGPLPTGTWYGNSQVYLWLSRAAGSTA